MKYLERVYWQLEQYYNEKKFFNMMKNIKKADDFKKYLFIDGRMNPIRSNKTACSSPFNSPYRFSSKILAAVILPSLRRNLRSYYFLLQRIKYWKLAYNQTFVMHGVITS